MIRFTAVAVLLAIPAATHAQPWLLSGSDIYFNTGRVGVGATPSASYLLDIVNSGIATTAAISAVDTRTTGLTRGINAGVASNQGSAVFAANVSTGGGVGVYGRSFDSTGTGFGIFGITSGVNNHAKAGGFRSSSDISPTVEILAQAVTGTARALHTESFSATGYSLWAVGGQAYIGSTLVGLGTMTPTAQLHVNGTVRFENIPAGNAVDVVSVAANGAAGRRAIQDPLGGAVEFVRTPTTGGFTWSVPAGVTRVRIIAVGGGRRRRRLLQRRQRRERSVRRSCAASY